MLPARLRARAAHRALHGHGHINRQRRAALLMIATGVARVLIWTALLGLNLVGVPFVVKLFGSVAFVADLSVLALMLTDWGQVAASLAQLTAGDAHHDAEQTRVAVETDFSWLDTDVARLAALQPGPDAQRLAQEIKARLPQH